MASTPPPTSSTPAAHRALRPPRARPATPFEVLPGVTPTWEGMAPATRVVTWFLAHVRVTGDEDAAARVMAPLVQCHQVVSDAPETIERTPSDYAQHVRDLLAALGRRFTVTEVLTEGDRVYVRWQQDGQDGQDERGPGGPGPAGAPLRDVGSAVYRVEDGRIAEYWVQLDRLGLERQLSAASPRAGASAPLALRPPRPRPISSDTERTRS